MTPTNPDNVQIADVLERVADLLEAQGAVVYRVRAYRNAAETLRRLARPVLEVLDATDGEKIPGIGTGLAGAIREFAHTGRLRLLDRLEGEVSPEDLFTTVPGIGEELARRIHDALHVETLEDLEEAVHDGRLARVPGFGPRRVRALREVLASLLARSSRRRARLLRAAEAPMAPPPVATILAVDEEYRRRAAAGELKRIAPRRFNPEGKAWLPVLHAERDGWDFTALFSNTARAHDLGMTGDWVVVYAERDGRETQATVVTERSGPLVGRRVVRGREAESMP